MIVRDRSIVGRINELFGRHQVVHYDNLFIGNGFMKGIDLEENSARFWPFCDVLGWQCNFDYQQTAEDSIKEYQDFIKNVQDAQNGCNGSNGTNSDPEGGLYG